MSATCYRPIMLSIAAVLLLVPTVFAGGSACPAWLSEGKATPGEECWAPLVTYRENIALLHGDDPVYLTRIELLVQSEHTFDTRSELEAYIQGTLILKGFWLEHPTRCDGNGDKCLLVPPSAFDHVEVRQIIDNVKRVAPRRNPPAR